MRYFIGLVAAVLASSPALAQDNMWAGAYVGVNAGFHAGDVSVTNSGSGVPVGPFDYDINGGIGGVTAGYNWFAGDMMLGAETSLGFMSVDGQGRIESSTPEHHQDLTLDSGVLVDFTGRIGFGLDNSLFYAKGGFAYFGGEANQVTTKVDQYSSTPTDGGFMGLTFGAGVEHFVTDQISLKAEYQHYSFGSEDGYQTATVADPPTPIGMKFPNSHEWGIDTIKVGINWHFD